MGSVGLGLDIGWLDLLILPVQLLLIVVHILNICVNILRGVGVPPFPPPQEQV